MGVSARLVQDLTVIVEQKAVQFTSKVTGGSLDYIIANAALLSDGSSWYSVEKL